MGNLSVFFNGMWDNPPEESESELSSVSEIILDCNAILNCFLVFFNARALDVFGI